jgi:hypothetical protein
MATNYDYIDEFSKQLARKRQLAALLQQQSMGGMQLPDRGGRASFLNALAPLAQAYFGTKMASAADTEGLAHQNEVNQQMQDAIANMPQPTAAMPPRPDMNLPGDLAGLAGQPGAPDTQAPTPPPDQQPPPQNPMAQLLAGANGPSLGAKMAGDQTPPMVPDLGQIGQQAAVVPPPMIPKIGEDSINPQLGAFVNPSGTPQEQAALKAAALADMQKNNISGPVQMSPPATPDAVPSDIPPMPPQGQTPPPSLAGPPTAGAVPPPNTAPPAMIPGNQPNMAPPGLILPAQAATTPNAYDMLKFASKLPPSPMQQQFMQKALENTLVEPDRRQAMIERHEARLDRIAQLRDAALERSQNMQLSIQQRADAQKEANQRAAEHNQTMLELARLRPQSGNAAADVPGDFTKTGQEFLASLPPEDAAVVQKIASGEIPLTTFSTRGGHREALAKQVSAYDPTFNATRSTMWREFTSGPTGKNITSINTAISHMGTMSDLANALQNGDVQKVNQFVNFLAVQTGDPSITNLETARQAVGEELMRTFRVAGASEHEAQAWMDKFKTANSPAQLQGSLSTAGTLLTGRIKAVNDNWKRGTQSNNDFPNIIPPENLATLQRLGVKKVGVPSLDAQLGAPSAPASGGKVDAAALAKEAKAAIAGGKDSAAVAARYKQMTGQDLQ